MNQRVKAAVIGDPVMHSRSPRIHQYWFEKYGIQGEYCAIEVAPAELNHFISHMRGEGFIGCNLTIPHKQAAMKMVDSLSEEAIAIGAINTIVVRENELHGTNTDAYGWLAYAKNHPAFANSLSHALMLGAGGAARAIAYALLQAGVQKISVANRTFEHAQHICELNPSRMKPLEWDAITSLLPEISLLVNTTSLGMQGKPALELRLDALPATALISDLVYAPLETALLREAKQRGHPTIDGLGMLLHQAAGAFHAWFGVMPQVTEELYHLAAQP